MTPRRKVIFGALLLLAAAGCFVEQRILSRQQEALAARSAEITRLESAIRRERHRTAELLSEHSSVDREVASARASAAEAEARSSMKLWANRIALLRRLLEEMPAESLPELRLLTTTDWVHVVRTRELDSPENIRSAFGALRAVGRQKMIEKLQEALKRFNDLSGGALPEHIEQLAPCLSAPADLEMLQRYTLLRSGRLADGDEVLIREKPTSDLIASIALKTWGLNNNQAWKPPGDENDIAAAARSTAALTAAFEQADPDGATELGRRHLEIIQEMFARLAPQMNELVAETIGADLKAATKRFSAARNGARPANLAELAPFMEKASTALPLVRPVLAELEYMQEHLGQRATDPAQLQRYLEKPVEQLKILRAFKLTYDGEHVSMDYSFKENSP